MFVSPTFLSNALTFALESYSIIEELKLRIIYELQPVCTEPLSERRSGQRAGVKERLLKVEKGDAAFVFALQPLKPPRSLSSLRPR